MFRDKVLKTKERLLVILFSVFIYKISNLFLYFSNIRKRTEKTNKSHLQCFQFKYLKTNKKKVTILELKT